MGRLTWQMVLLFMAVVLGAAGVQGPAYAHDHRPPETVLKKGARELQTGRLGSYCWFSPSGGGCRDVVGPTFPAADSVRAGAKLNIQILKPQKPEKLSVTAHQRVNEQGFPVGKRQQIKTSLRRVVENGQTVAWDVSFRLNHPDRHYYLEAFGVWPDVQTGADQDASWAFHVRT